MFNSLFSKKPASSSDSAPAFSTSQLATLAIEHWRLSSSLGTSAPAPARHALRKIDDLLKSLGIQAQSLDNLPHDPGMNATVIDRVIDPNLPPGPDIIIETVSPLVLLNGTVIKPAEIVLGTSSPAGDHGGAAS